MKVAMIIDPGEHIGYVVARSDKAFVQGDTIQGDTRNAQLWRLLQATKPSTIVYEMFALRANVAQKLVGNKFITCEVIGVIKLYAQLYNVPLIELTPSCKEYCGFSSNPKDTQYKLIETTHITEHVRDAYRLYRYAKLFKGV